ncbi:MAG TPA: hypothetical protein PK597_08300, partial [Oscillospiraceae bacterium]|nr:hypothetical protein [Oscillospiraceae bacterium]
ITKRDANMLIMLLGIILFVGVYFGVYNTFQTKTDKVQGEIAELSPRLETLRGYYNSLDTYRAAIETDGEFIQDEMKHYPEEVRTEDFIMYAVKLENRTGMDIQSASFAEPEHLFDFSSVEKDPTTASGYKTVTLAAWRADMSVTGMFSYTAFKSALAYIYDENAYRTAVDSVTVSYDAESGNLSGSISLQKFYIADEDYTYTPTVVPSRPLGNSNPFGTIQLGE